MLFGRNNVSRSSGRTERGSGLPKRDASDGTSENPPRNRLRNGLGFGSLLAASGGAGAVAVKNKARILPIVLIHGILSSAIHFEEAADWAHALGEDVYVRCIEIGNGEVDSITRTYVLAHCAPSRALFAPHAHFEDALICARSPALHVRSRCRMEWQLARLAEELQSDVNLRAGFNIIAHSQGTLLARAFVQRYDWPQVDTLVSWVGPQAGQFGVPTYEPLLGYMNRLVSGLWYDKNLQSESGRTLSFSNYWRDPTKLDMYRANSGFLADINNERDVKNASYAERLARLSHFVLVYSTGDTIIQPAISSWFGFYRDNSSEVLEPLAARKLYTEDWIGLKRLDTTGRLHFGAVDCPHTGVATARCKLQVWDQITKGFLAPKGGIEGLLPWLHGSPAQTARPRGYSSSTMPAEAYWHIRKDVKPGSGSGPGGSFAPSAPPSLSLIHI